MNHTPTVTKSRVNNPSSDSEDFQLEAKFTSVIHAKKEFLPRMEKYVNKRLILEINYIIYSSIYDALEKAMEDAYDLPIDQKDYEQFVKILESVRNSIPRIELD